MKANWGIWALLTRLGALVVVGGGMHGGSADAQAIPPGPGGLGSETPDHLVVQFHITSVDNVATGGDGVYTVNDLVPLLNFELSGDPGIVTSEHSPYALPVPAPGETLGLLAGHPVLMYEGLVEEGCGHIPVYPVYLDSAVYVLGMVPAAELGHYTTSDEETIEPNGYWNFAYTVAISDGMGNTSDIEVKGTVSARCALPSELALPERYEGEGRFLFPAQAMPLHIGR